MKLNEKNKANAKSIFEGDKKIAVLYMNPKGEFFTNRNYATNSTKGKEVSEVRRADILKTEASVTSSDKTGKTKASGSKLVVVSTGGDKLKFNIEEDETPEAGSKAKVGNKNADGIYTIDPQLKYKFEKGVLVEVIES